MNQAASRSDSTSAIHLPAESNPVDAGGGPRREGWWLALFALIGAVVAVGGLWLVSGGPSATGASGDRLGGEAAGAVSTTVAGAGENGSATTMPPPTASGETGGDSVDSDSVDSDSVDSDSVDSDSVGGVETSACPAETPVEICEAVAFVEEARGDSFVSFPVVELLSDRDFDAALLSSVEDYEGEVAVEEHLLKSLGLIDPDLDLFQTYLDLLEVGVVGFYDPDTTQMVVRGDSFDLYGRLVLVHELTHAYDDQHYDLSRTDFPDADAEYAYAAVIEGNASRVERAWRDRLSATEEELLSRQELSAIAPEDLTRLFALPPVILELQLSPYTDGLVYVDAIVAEGGEEAVNRALVDPPATSETILHPRAGAEALAVDPVPAVEPDGDEVGRGRIGELLTGFWLDPTAAAGWGDDAFVLTDTGDSVCARITMAADTTGDLDEIEASARRWAGSGDRTVDRTTRSGRDLVVVDACY